MLTNLNYQPQAHTMIDVICTLFSAKKKSNNKSHQYRINIDTSKHRFIVSKCIVYLNVFEHSVNAWLFVFCLFFKGAVIHF